MKFIHEIRTWNSYMKFVHEIRTWNSYMKFIHEILTWNLPYKKFTIDVFRKCLAVHIDWRTPLVEFGVACGTPATHLDLIRPWLESVLTKWGKLYFKIFFRELGRGVALLQYRTKNIWLSVDNGTLQIFALSKIRKIDEFWKDLEKTQKVSSIWAC
jgi:hypothetical protein